MGGAGLPVLDQDRPERESGRGHQLLHLFVPPVNLILISISILVLILFFCFFCTPFVFSLAGFRDN